MLFSLAPALLHLGLLLPLRLGVRGAYVAYYACAEVGVVQAHGPQHPAQASQSLPVRPPSQIQQGGTRLLQDIHGSMV